MITGSTELDVVLLSLLGFSLGIITSRVVTRWTKRNMDKTMKKRRLSVLDGPSEETLHARIWLDGKDITMDYACITADEVAGYVDVYVKKGRDIAVDDRGAPYTKRLHGEVQIL